MNQHLDATTYVCSQQAKHGMIWYVMAQYGMVGFGRRRRYNFNFYKYNEETEKFLPKE